MGPTMLLLFQAMLLMLAAAKPGDLLARHALVTAGVPIHELLGSDMLLNPRQVTTCVTAGQTVCPNVFGCCPSGVPCTYTTISGKAHHACASVCPPISVPCADGLCCPIGDACGADDRCTSTSSGFSYAIPTFSPVIIPTVVLPPSPSSSYYSSTAPETSEYTPLPSSSEYSFTPEPSTSSSSSSSAAESTPFSSTMMQSSSASSSDDLGVPSQSSGGGAGAASSMMTGTATPTTGSGHRAVSSGWTLLGVLLAVGRLF